ncbi:MAG: cytochrome c-550 PedF [Pseudomonadota bacterium]
MSKSTPKRLALAAVALCAATTVVLAHGNVTPQAVDASALPAVGEDWLFENPYRELHGAEFEKVLAIGDSAYNQNCARCHGLGVVSGGLAPDLRKLEAEEYGDEWFMERYRNGYTQSGITKMPGFGDLFGQEVGWAIRLYAETRPDDKSIAKHNAELVEIRDALKAWSGGDTASMEARLLEINGEIKTFSGAPMADSVARRAALALADGDTEGAAEALTVGLSAAK